MNKSNDLVFERDPNSIYGFGSANRANTDALNALLRWEAKVATRGFTRLDDDEDDDVLCARLTWNSDDGNAGFDLDDCCGKFGVKRRSANAE